MKKIVFALISASLLILLAFTAPVTAGKVHIPLIVKLHRTDSRSFNFSAVNKTEVVWALFFAFLAVVCFKRAVAIFRYSELVLENILLALLWVQYSLYSAMIATILIIDILIDLGVVTEDG